MNGSSTARLRARAIVHPTAAVGEFVTLGSPAEESLQLGVRACSSLAEVTVEAGCIIQNFVTLYEGVHLGKNVVVDDYCRVGSRTRVASGSRLSYRAFICDNVSIGEDCRVAGFICDDTVIEPRCTVMGSIVHEYTQPHLDWWEVTESAPTIRHDSIVGMSAMIVGGVTIGPYAYVAASAVVTRDVPPWHVAVGNNKFIPCQSWTGGKLSRLFAHWQSLENR